MSTHINQSLIPKTYHLKPNALNINTSLFSKSITLAKDILFPIFCFGCKKEGQWLCADCAFRLVCSGVYACPVCHEANATGIVCKRCESASFLTSHVAILKYDEKSIFAQLLHAYKYEFATEVEKIIKPTIINFFGAEKSESKNVKLFSEIDFTVPVPLHPRRFAERGFNQSEQIALVVAALLKKPLLNVLRRNRFTTPQARLKKQERKVNIAGAFAGAADVKGKKILLIDDVFTTGATMQECARVLRENGAREVVSFSLARAK